MLRRPGFLIAAGLLLVVAVAVIFSYARSGKAVRIEITGTEGLRWKGTVEADGVQMELAGPVFPKSSMPNQIRVASARHVEFTIKKADGEEGELAVDVFRDDERLSHASAGEGMRFIRGNVSPGTASSVVTAK